MRLLAAYSLCRDRRAGSIRFITPEPLTKIATACLGDRLIIVDQSSHADYILTHQGPSSVWKDLVRGQKYIFPFVHVTLQRKQKEACKQAINKIVYSLLNLSRRGLIPSTKHIEFYHGFMQIACLQPFQNIPYDYFQVIAKADLPEITARLRLHLSVSLEVNGGNASVVFPSGTSHQIMPPEAAINYGCSIAAFHKNDPFAATYASAGFAIRYFESVEEMISVGRDARRVLCTDSFPSHIWQTFGGRVTLALTQQTGSRVIHPGFNGTVIESKAKCCPCLPLARTSMSHLCDAGHVYCTTWTN